MSEPKRKFNPWVATVIVGVVAILFSVFAFQQEAELIEARKEVDRLKMELNEMEKRAQKAESMSVVLQKQLEQALIDAQIAKEVAESANKSSKKK